MAFKIVVGRGRDRRTFPVIQKGKEHHEQRRSIKLHVGLLR